MINGTAFVEVEVWRLAIGIFAALLGTAWSCYALGRLVATGAFSERELKREAELVLAKSERNYLALCLRQARDRADASESQRLYQGSALRLIKPRSDA